MKGSQVVRLASRTRPEVKSAMVRPKGGVPLLLLAWAHGGESIKHPPPTHVTAPYIITDKQQAKAPAGRISMSATHGPTRIPHNSFKRNAGAAPQGDAHACCHDPFEQAISKGFINHVGL